MAKRKQVRAWIKGQDEGTKEVYRTEIDAWCVKINGVDLIVHQSLGFHNGLKLWNISEPFTGLKIGSKRSSMESAIKLGRDYVKNLEKDFGKPFTEMIEEKQKFWGDVMELPEKEAVTK
jgi:hypothetical protein